MLLKEQELVTQLILSSDALRARQTVEFLTGGAGYDGEIKWFRSLYMAESSVYQGALSATPDEIERVMVVGHNPGIEGLLQMLTQRIEALPPATIAYLSVPVHSWKELNFEVECELVEWLELSEEDEEKTHEKDKGIVRAEKKAEKKASEKEDYKHEKKGKK